MLLSEQLALLSEFHKINVVLVLLFYLLFDLLNNGLTWMLNVLHAELLMLFIAETNI